VTVDNAFSAQVEFESGALGTLTGSRVATGQKNAFTVEIEGTAGAVQFDLERLNELQVLTGGDRGSSASSSRTKRTRTWITGGRRATRSAGNTPSSTRTTSF